jgi:hypothetical protein
MIGCMRYLQEVQHSFLCRYPGRRGRAITDQMIIKGCEDGKPQPFPHHLSPLGHEHVITFPVAIRRCVAENSEPFLLARRGNPAMFLFEVC